MVTPPEAGQKLYDAAGKLRYLCVEPDTPHLQTYLGNPRRYKKRLIDFFDTWLLGD